MESNRFKCIDVLLYEKLTYFNNQIDLFAKHCKNVWDDGLF
jgi:hypothetical protein